MHYLFKHIGEPDAGGGCKDSYTHRGDLACMPTDAVHRTSHLLGVHPDTYSSLLLGVHAITLLACQQAAKQTGDSAEAMLRSNVCR